MLRMAMGGYPETKTEETTTSVFLCMCHAFLYCFYFNQLHKNIYHNIITLYNVHSYMFRHLLREFKNLCLANLLKFLKLRLLKLQFHKIIRLKYIKILFGRHCVKQ